MKTCQLQRRIRVLAFATFLLNIALAPMARAAVDPAEVLPPCCRKELAPAKPLLDASIYQLESHWTSDVGKRIRLGILRGKPQLVAMFFTKCEYACPILVHDLKRIESALPAELRDAVGFTLVSFDTERDTSAVLRNYRKIHELSPKRWTLLRGDADDVRELAALLGIVYKKDARGQFEHSNVLTLLDAEGQVHHQLQGLNQPVDDMVARIRKLLPTPASSSSR